MGGTMKQRTDLDPVRDQLRLLDHANYVGSIVSQTQLREDLWAIEIEWGLIPNNGQGRPVSMVYFDKEIVWSRPKKPKSFSGFKILIRHAYDCADPDGVAYIYIAAGSIFERSAHQPFRAAIYQEH